MNIREIIVKMLKRGSTSGDYAESSFNPGNSYPLAKGERRVEIKID